MANFCGFTLVLAFFLNMLVVIIFKAKSTLVLIITLFACLTLLNLIPLLTLLTLFSQQLCYLLSSTLTLKTLSRVEEDGPPRFTLLKVAVGREASLQSHGKRQRSIGDASHIFLLETGKKEIKLPISLI